MSKIIYLDNAATTRIKKEVVETMLPYLTEEYANPAAIYKFANNAKIGIEKSRKQIAKILNASEKEIYFTSGGTESNNWAIKEIAVAYKEKGNHIITTKVEHHSIIESCRNLEKQGFEVTYLDVDKYGFISLEQLRNSIRESTILISIMFANNEVGTIMPVEEIGRIARSKGIIFHTDAVQAFCHVDIDVERMNIDLLSSSAHKYHGPKGVGFLYVRQGIQLPAYHTGGSQEHNLRAGTHNVAGIVGMGKAASIAACDMNAYVTDIIEKRDYLINGLCNEFSKIYINGPLKERLPNNISICIEDIRGIDLVTEMAKYDICVSSGAACNESKILPSHVLLAMGISSELAIGGLRITISNEIDYKDLDYFLNVLKKCIEYLRGYE